MLSLPSLPLTWFRRQLSFLACSLLSSPLLPTIHPLPEFSAKTKSGHTHLWLEIIWKLHILGQTVPLVGQQNLHGLSGLLSPSPANGNPVTNYRSPGATLFGPSRCAAQSAWSILPILPSLANPLSAILTPLQKPSWGRGSSSALPSPSFFIVLPILPWIFPDPSASHTWSPGLYVCHGTH